MLIDTDYSLQSYSDIDTQLMEERLSKMIEALDSTPSKSENVRETASAGATTDINLPPGWTIPSASSSWNGCPIGVYVNIT